MLSHPVNRRLDEWLPIERFESLQKVADTSNKDVPKPSEDMSDGTDRKITRNQKRKHDEINHVQKVRVLSVAEIIFN